MNQELTVEYNQEDFKIEYQNIEDEIHIYAIYDSVGADVYDFFDEVIDQFEDLIREKENDIYDEYVISQMIEARR